MTIKGRGKPRRTGSLRPGELSGIVPQHRASSIDNDKRLKAILVRFKLMGGRGRIEHFRDFAKAETGDRFAKKLIALGLMKKLGHDDYQLTYPEGYAAANKAGDTL